MIRVLSLTIFLDSVIDSSRSEIISFKITPASTSFAEMAKAFFLSLWKRQIINIEARGKTIKVISNPSLRIFFRYKLTKIRVDWPILISELKACHFSIGILTYCNSKRNENLSKYSLIKYPWEGSLKRTILHKEAVWRNVVDFPRLQLTTSNPS